MNLKACRQHTWIVTLLYVGHCFCAVTITQSSTNVDKGSSLNIIATFDEASLSWTYKQGTPLSTCSLVLNNCFPSQEQNMMFTVSSTTNTSTLSIASLNCSINTATYVASTDSLQTDTVNIDVTTPVSSGVSTTVLTTSKVPSQDLSVEVKCVYPQSTITANFTISRSGKPDDILFPDSIQTSTSSSGCECSEDTYVVKKTITASQYPNEVVQVQANIGHLSPLVIGDVNFTAGVHTSTPTPITKPPSDNKNCIRTPYIEDIPCGIIETVIAIVAIAVIVALFYSIFHRRKICNKKEIDKTTKQFECLENSDKTKEREVLDISTANNPHEDSAKYRDDNLCLSSPKRQVSLPSGTNKEIQSPESTDSDLQQHKNVSNDDTNRIMKNETKGEGTSRKEDNTLRSTLYNKESKSDDYDGRLTQSPESTDNIKQNKSVANNATNFRGKHDNNGLKSEVTSETKI